MQTRAEMDREITRTGAPNELGHVTRFSDSSLYDEVCVKCGATDAPNDCGLQRPCGGIATATPNANADQHVADPQRRWSFDAEVTKNFEAMLENSIPGYADMRALVEAMAIHALERHPSGLVIDLGASRGDGVALLMQRFDHARFALCEISRPMVDVLERRFSDQSARVEIVSVDLSENPSWLRARRATLTLSVLTLMFVPVECRQQLVDAVYDALEPGGSFIVVEKTLGDDARAQRMLVDAYHRFKVQRGYTEEMVERKRLSLKGSLVPLKAQWTRETLYDAGFSLVQEFWRSYQFVAWIATKGE